MEVRQVRSWRLVCVSPAGTLTCTTLYKLDMQGVKKDVSACYWNTCSLMGRIFVKILQASSKQPNVRLMDS